MKTARCRPVRVSRKEHGRSGCIYPAFVFLYAEKGGGPVLKGEARWWKISGFLVHVKSGHVVVSFRRHWSS